MNKQGICNIEKTQSGDLVDKGMRLHTPKVITSVFQNDNFFVKPTPKEDFDNEDASSHCSGFSYEAEVVDKAVGIKDESFKKLSLKEKIEKWLGPRGKLCEGFGIEESTAEEQSLRADVNLHTGEADVLGGQSNDKGAVCEKESLPDEGVLILESHPLTELGQDIQPSAAERNHHFGPRQLLLEPDKTKFNYTSDTTNVLSAPQMQEREKSLTSQAVHSCLADSSNVNPFRNAVRHMSGNSAAPDVIPDQESTNVYTKMQPDFTPEILHSFSKTKEGTPEFPAMQTCDSVCVGSLNELSTSLSEAPIRWTNFDPLSKNAGTEDKEIPTLLKLGSFVQIGHGANGHECASSASIPSIVIFPANDHPMQGIIDSSGEAKMRAEIWRLSTFSKLSDLPVSAMRLAQSGFYYDEELDEIICFSCGVRRRHWSRSDFIHDLHLQLSPECEQANCCDERNIPMGRFPHVSGATTSTTNGFEGITQSSSSNGAMSPDGEFTDTTISDTHLNILQGLRENERLHRESNDTRRSSSEQMQSAAVEAATDSFVTNRDQQLETDFVENGATFSPPEAFPAMEESSLALPTPAGRAERLERHRQMAALSAGTARLAELDSASPITTRMPATLQTIKPLPSRTGQQGAEATHPGKESAQPPLNHFTPAASGTVLVYNCVQAVQAPHANPYKRRGSYTSRQNGDEGAGAGEISGDGLLDMRRAASPENAMVSVRLATFTDWPTRGLPNKRLMVLAGFYFMGTGDSVRCFYCGVTLRNWREDDDPWVTHVRFRFSCDYVIVIKGEDFVFKAQMQIALGRSITTGDDSIAFTEPAAVTNGIATSSPPTTSQETLPTTTSSNATSENASRSTATSANATTARRADSRWPATGGRGTEEPSDPESCSSVAQRAGNPGVGNGMNGTVGGGENTYRSYDTSDGAAAPSSSFSSSSAGDGSGSRGAGKQNEGKVKGGAGNIAASNGGASVVAVVQAGAEILQTDAGPGKVRAATSPLQTNRQTVAVGGQSTISRSTVSTEHPTMPNAGAAARDQDAVTFFRQLQETNQRLRRRVTCRLCGDRPVDTIFLPCGHLCTCETCAATITLCCLCNDRIRGTAHVYME